MWWPVSLCTLALLLASGAAVASDYRGQILFEGLPVPGATVVAIQGDKKLNAVSDEQGYFFFLSCLMGHTELR